MMHNMGLLFGTLKMLVHKFMVGACEIVHGLYTYENVNNYG